MNELAQAFIGKAQKYNQYSQTDESQEVRRCRDCIRWRFSYPYNCSDFDMASDKAQTCLNFSTDPKCPVD